MPNARAIRLHGPRRGWISRKITSGDRADVLEWLESSLPEETQAILRGEEPEPGAEPAPSPLIPETSAADLMDARAAVVLAFEAWHAARGGPLVAALRDFVAEYAAGGVDCGEEVRGAIESVHWSTLQRWRSKYLHRGIRSLKAKPGGRKSILASDEDMADLVASMIFARPHHVTARQIHRALRTRFPDRDIPSIRAIQNYIARFKTENRLALDAVADPDGHRSRNLPAFGDAGASIERLNQIWELDSTPADLLCADGKRYAIIGAIDVWSRRGKLILSPTSCAAAIAAVLRRCLIDWGVPEVIRTDEGSDYLSKHIRRVIADLGVHHDILPPFSPDKKPFIERFLGTLNRDLISQLPGFIGHSVADRNRIEARRSFAQRRGKSDAEIFEVGLLPEELQARLDSWCDALYAHEPHSGLGGQTPFARAASSTDTMRTVDPRTLDILLAPAAGGGTRSVSVNGISVDGGTYIAAELGDHMRARVQVRQDPADWGRIYVFTPAGDFICIAEDPARTGIDRKEIAARAKAWRAQADKAARRLARDLVRAQIPETIMDEVLAAAADASGTVTPFPKPTVAHDSDGVAAAKTAAQPPRARSSHARNAKFVQFYKMKGKI